MALLAQLGITPAAIAPPDIDESVRAGELPRPHALRLAREKAETARRPDAYVIAADTVVGVGRRILPKATTREQAESCLQLLSGRRHHVLTAVVVVAPDGRTASRVADTAVAFARLQKAQLLAYLATDEWRGKAGGYAIQGRAAAFVRMLLGSYSGVVGLPLFETAQLLRGLGYPLP